jgi:hypothetical protein
MFHPTILILDLTGNGELIILFRQSFAILFTILPMLIRPKTGGVIAKPLIMLNSSL